MAGPSAPLGLASFSRAAGVEVGIVRRVAGRFAAWRTSLFFFVSNQANPMAHLRRMTRFASLRTHLVAIVASTAVACGCGSAPPPRVPVTVKVAYANQKPVAGARVMLQSADGIVYRATAGQDGVGSVTDPQGAEGVPPGSYSVAIAEGRPTMNLDSPDQGPKIAPRFANFESSGLAATVAIEGPNALEFVVAPQ